MSPTPPAFAKPTDAYLEQRQRAANLGQPRAVTAAAAPAAAIAPPSEPSRVDPITLKQEDVDHSPKASSTKTAKGQALMQQMQKMLLDSVNNSEEPPAQLLDLLREFAIVEAEADLLAMMPYVTANLDTILAEHGTGKAAMRTSQKSVKQLLFESASRQNELHVRWRNAMGNVTFEPLQIRKVTTFQDVVDVYVDALAAGVTVKAVGSGHSYSLNMQTEGFVIDTSGLLKSYANTTSPLVGQLDASLLKQPTREVNGQVRPWLQIEGEPLIYPFASDGGSYDPATVDQNTAYFEAEAGITIYELIDALEKNNLGLVNMGGAAWQTLAGYASTSTHGSGINFGPVADGIKSLVLITTGEWPAEKGLTVPAKAGSLGAGGVWAYRIEPSSGITDPQAYAASSAAETVGLIQDDAAFSAACVSFGALGTLYSIVLVVQQFYWLEQIALLTTWDVLVADPATHPDDPAAGLMHPSTDADDQMFPTGWLSPAPRRSNSAPLQRCQQLIWSPYPTTPYKAFGMAPIERAALPHGVLYCYNYACPPCDFESSKNFSAGRPTILALLWKFIEPTVRSTIASIWGFVGGVVGGGIGGIDPCAVLKQLVCAAAKRKLTELEFQILVKVQGLQVTYDLVALLMHFVPEICPLCCNAALGTQETVQNKRGPYYDIFLLGTPENAGFASEYAFPLQEYTPVDDSNGQFGIWAPTPSAAGNYTLVHLERGLREITETGYSIWSAGRTATGRGGHFLTSPMGVRTVAASEKFLSMQHAVRTMMVELDMAFGTYAGYDTLQTLGFRLNQLGCRFHWGLDFCTGQSNQGQIEKAYPQAKAWAEVARIFNAKGTHTNQFLCSLLGVAKYPVAA